MERYEYRIEERMLYMDAEELNALGRAGWLLVDKIDRELPLRYTFCRVAEALRTP